MEPERMQIFSPTVRDLRLTTAVKIAGRASPSPAERDAAGLVLLRPVADGGVEAEELQEAPAPRAPARRGLARAGGEVPHQQPQAVFRRARIAAGGEDAVERVHGLGELAVRLPRGPAPGRVLQQPQELMRQRRVVVPRKAPPVGRLDGGAVPGGQARAAAALPAAMCHAGGRPFIPISSFSL